MLINDREGSDYITLSNLDTHFLGTFDIFFLSLYYRDPVPKKSTLKNNRKITRFYYIRNLNASTACRSCTKDRSHIVCATKNSAKKSKDGPHDVHHVSVTARWKLTERYFCSNMYYIWRKFYLPQLSQYEWYFTVMAS